MVGRDSHNLLIIFFCKVIRQLNGDIGMKNAHAYLKHDEVLAVYEKVLSGKEFDSINTSEDVRNIIK